MRASDLLGATAYGRDGQPLGTVCELICENDTAGPRVTHLLVSPRRRRRLLGYERPGIQGPWLLERLAGWLHRGTHTVPYGDVRLAPADT